MGKWDSIPVRYHPITGKPWRVTWGIGAFEDFSTLEGAERFARRERDQLKRLRTIWDDRLITFEDIEQALEQARAEGRREAVRERVGVVPCQCPKCGHQQVHTPDLLPIDERKAAMKGRVGRYGWWDHEPDTADAAYECESDIDRCRMHPHGVWVEP